MNSDFEIVNLALVRLGSVRITALSDGSRNALEANSIYTSIRDDELSKHPWKFATRRASLELYVKNVLTIAGITQADPGVVTYTGTDPEDGDQYAIASITGMVELNGNTYIIHDVDTGANTFEIYDTYGEPVDTTAYVAWGAGGTCTEVAPISDDFEYMFVLPSDCLRVVALNDDPAIEFEIDENGLMCNVDEVEALYIRRITTVSKYSSEFNDALAWRLAQELAIVITGSPEKMKMCAQMYSMALDKATAADATEKRDEYPTYDRYRKSRRGLVRNTGMATLL